MQSAHPGHQAQHRDQLVHAASRSHEPRARVSVGLTAVSGLIMTELIEGSVRTSIDRLVAVTCTRPLHGQGLVEQVVDHLVGLDVAHGGLGGSRSGVGDSDGQNPWHNVLLEAIPVGIPSHRNDVLGGCRADAEVMVGGASEGVRGAEVDTVLRGEEAAAGQVRTGPPAVGNAIVAGVRTTGRRSRRRSCRHSM